MPSHGRPSRRAAFPTAPAPAAGARHRRGTGPGRGKRVKGKRVGSTGEGLQRRWQKKKQQKTDAALVGASSSSHVINSENKNVPVVHANAKRRRSGGVWVRAATRAARALFSLSPLPPSARTPSHRTPQPRRTNARVTPPPLFLSLSPSPSLVHDATASVCVRAQCVQIDHDATRCAIPPSRPREKAAVPCPPPTWWPRNLRRGVCVFIWSVLPPSTLFPSRTPRPAKITSLRMATP